MTTIPGPVAYPEGETLQQSIYATISFLSEIEDRAAGSWTATHTAAAQMYRLEMQSTIVKAIELLRTIHPLSRYVGGERANGLTALFNAAATEIVAYRDDPTEPTMRSMASAVIAAIRQASDLVLMGAAVDEARAQGARTSDELQRAVETRLASATSTVDALAVTLRQEMSGVSDRLKSEADRLSDELTARGKETIARTKNVIAGIHLTAAQEEFARAQKGFNWQVALWSALALASFAAFLATSAVFLSTQQIQSTWTWQIAFFAGMRLVLLGGIAAAGSFCLRMLKSQIALAQLNAHRTRVARSMPGLIELAPESDRLAVLQSLIHTIVAAKESTLDDSNPESLLTAAEAVERIVKAAKGN